MHNRVTLARAVLLLLIISLCSLGAYVSPMHAGVKRDVSIATGGVTGAYFPAGTAICRMVKLEREKHGFRCSAKRTSGAVANIRGLRNGKFDFALVPSDLRYQASRGEGVFEEPGPFEGLRAVFSLHAELFTVIVHADSGIKTFDNLQNKRVNLGPPGSDQRRIMEHVIDAKDWNLDSSFQRTELSSAEQIGALCDKKVDAISYFVGHPSGTLRGLAKYCPVKIIGVSEKDIEKLILKKSYYSRGTIPGKMYANNPDDVITFGVRATLVTTEGTSPQAVYAVVSSVFDNLDRFRRSHPIFKRLNLEEMAGKLDTKLLHEGASRYYRELGLLY